MKALLMRAGVAVTVGASVLAGTASVAGASGRPGGGAPPAEPTVTVVADHLNNPRQIALHDGALYVAEAGLGGEPVAPGAPGIGFTGSVTRYRNGRATRVQTGLLSVSVSEGGGGEVLGIDALAFKGDQLFGIATGTCPSPEMPLPPEVTVQLGKLLRLDGGSRVKAVADISAVECATDPDGQGPDTNPYGLAVKGNSFFVADAAGNDILKVRKGEVSVASVLSTTAQPVPTSLAFGPDGGLYIGTLNFEGGPGSAKVYRLDVKTGQLSVYAEGLFAITGIAFDKRGNLYVSELTTGFGEMGLLPDGDVVVIPPGGGAEGRRVLGAGSLHFPGGVAVTRDGVYVSNWSIAPGEDGPFGPGNHGQLVRISFDRGHGGHGDDGDDGYDCSREQD